MNNIRHRHSGRAHWLEFHPVFRDGMTVRDAHERATEIEAVVAEIVPSHGRVITPMEARSKE